MNNKKENIIWISVIALSMVALIIIIIVETMKQHQNQSKFFDKEKQSETVKKPKILNTFLGINDIKIEFVKENGEYSCNISTNTSLEINGMIDDNVCTFGNLNSNTRYFYNLCVKKDDITTCTDMQVGYTKVDSSTSGLYKKYENGQVVYFNPETAKLCDETIVTDGKTGCLKWYVFNDDSNNDKVNLLLDHNTTPAVYAKTKPYNFAEILTVLASDTASWDQSLGIRLIEASEIAKITGNDNFDANASKDGYYFETNSANPATYTDKYGWLYDKTGNNCEETGCLNNTQESEISTNGYWTSTPLIGSSEDAWCVSNSGFMYAEAIFSLLGNDYGIRPVITVLKSSFENVI